MPWSDAHTNLGEIQTAILDFTEARDWSKYHCPRNLAMAVSAEAAELLALYLWSRDDGPQPPVAGREALVAEEAADVLITLLNLTARAGIDLAAATEAKMKKNADKYPVERFRGRLEKWNELGARPVAAAAAHEPHAADPTDPTDPTDRGDR